MPLEKSLCFKMLESDTVLLTDCHSIFPRHLPLQQKIFCFRKVKYMANVKWIKKMAHCQIEICGVNGQI